MKWLCVFMLAYIAAFSYATLNMAAFNIKTLGVTKMGKPEVVDILVKIITRYDLVVIQELRDASGEAIVDLLNDVNAYSADEYNMTIGSRVGRTSYKEEYVFMYKKATLTPTGYYEYAEPNDEFEREPMIVRFTAVDDSAEQQDFAVMAIHTKPSDAVAELDYLADVYDDVVATWGIEDVAIVGDFNAGCSYVGSNHWENIRLRTQSRFHWLLSDWVDTATSSSDCAYDRLVVTGSLMCTAHSASVFYYDAFYNLTPTEASAVSDHYPVEMTID
ncbi:deoxyribonuclease-1-like [Amphiura filiformis]|uniref:deoxyribonuclease-1-like n=1 Tax=Amphiura filiformis TaxID=82378 RepID=UPI003B21519F